MRGLDHSWVPLHFAIGWLLTRDPAFVANLPLDGSTRMLAVAIAIAKGSGTKANAIRDGWLALHDAMLTAKVRAQGIPYQRRTRSRTCVETAEVRRDILPSEIAEANLRDDKEYRDCLIPKRWHVSKVPFFRDIHVSRADLLKVFTATPPTIKDETGARRALADLLREKPTLLRAEARAQLTANGFKISDRAFLTRVWPQARVDAGLPAVARAGRRPGR
jgi:hypothetical protein